MTKRSIPDRNFPAHQGPVNVEKVQKAQLSHQEIVHGLQKGDERVLGQVYGKYVQHLFRFGSQFTHDRDLVLDCIHEVFMSLLKSGNDLNNIKSLKSYLFKALYREIINQLKKNRLTLTGTAENEPNFSIEISPQASMIETEKQKEIIHRLNTAVNQISAKQRQAILNYYYDGLTHQEIAEVMGLQNKKAVSKLISRGIKALRAFVKSTTISLLPLYIFLVRI